MNTFTALPPALDLVRQALHEQLGLAPADIQPETELAALGVDSLALAELLFTLEDRLGAELADVATLPRTVGELVAHLEPHLPRLLAAQAA